MSGLDQFEGQSAQASPGNRVVGRGRELQLLQERIESSRAGLEVVIVSGDRGIGKSALISASLQDALTPDLLVLRATGAPDETFMPFAGLDQLTLPGSPAKAELPEMAYNSFRDVLRAASEDTAQEVGLATLELVRQLGARRHLIIVLEDVQWLDLASAEVLTFVIRRIEDVPMLVVISAVTRPAGPFSDVAMSELKLNGLGKADSESLIDDVADLGPALRERLLEEAQGSPLALTELAAAWTGRRDFFEEEPYFPLSDRLRRATEEPLSALPEATRRVLLVAALARTDHVSEILDAARRGWGTDDAADALYPALEAGLVEVSSSVLRFLHPLVRSVLYHGATLAERLAAHESLARVTCGERSVWHEASSVVWPDDELALKLDLAATAAWERGELGLTYSLLRLAVDRTSDLAAAGRRLVGAAESAIEAGVEDAAAVCVVDAERLPLLPVDRARLEWVRRYLNTGVWHDAHAVAPTLEVIERLVESGQPRLALRALAGLAVTAATYRVDAAQRDRIRRVADRIQAIDEEPQKCLIAAACDGIRGATGPSTGQPSVEQEDARALQFHTRAAAMHGDARLTVRLAARSLASPPLELPDPIREVMAASAWAHWSVGEWDAAMALATQAYDVGGRRLTPAACRAGLCAAAISVVRGDVEHAETLTQDIDGISRRHWGQVRFVARMVRGVTSLSRGDAEDAFDHLDALVHAGDPGVEAEWAETILSFYADAARQTDRVARAHSVIQRLENQRPVSVFPGLEIGLAYAHALLADDSSAQPRFESALARARADSRPFLTGRLSLAYGAWLRRHRQSRRSRSLLRASREAFQQLGAVAWENRAQQELRASGEIIRRRDIGVIDELTPQEIEIAGLAATGLTNRLIGQRLYLSPRTVGTHLYRIFPKLGITSRHELPGALTRQSGGGDPNALHLSRVTD